MRRPLFPLRVNVRKGCARILKSTAPTGCKAGTLQFVIEAYTLNIGSFQRTENVRLGPKAVIRVQSSRIAQRDPIQQQTGSNAYCAPLRGSTPREYQIEKGPGWVA
jgi:hypothetical protein